MATFKIYGKYIDILLGEEARPERPNLVVGRALDLITDLLASKHGICGLLYWAVGPGDPAWDAAGPPAPDRTTLALTHEAYRQRLDATNFSYNPATHVLTVHVLIPDGVAIGDLREFGVFGGNASGGPSSGYLFSYARHPVIHKAAGQTLDRTLKITLGGDNILPALLDTAAALLSNQAGVSGISTIAFGAGLVAWDAAAPAFDPARKALTAEILRKQLDPKVNLDVLPYQQAVRTRVALEFSEAPSILREAGLFGGPVAAPALLSHQVFAKVDHTVAARLQFELHFGVGVDPSTSVPDLSTKTIAGAQAVLAAAGLQLGTVTEEEHPGGAGAILRQDPTAGTKAVPGGAVRVTVSVPPNVLTPRLIGLKSADATALLATVGLTLAAGPQKMESPQPQDTILSQDPPAATLIRPGSSVSVVIATPETTLVPDLTGLLPPEAFVVLGASRLRLAAAPFPTLEAQSGWGRIVGQDLAAGSRQVVNTPVKPTLAAPPLITVPDLSEANLQTSSQILRDAAADILKKGGWAPEPPGLAIGKVTQVENAAAPYSILNQVPAANEKAPLFSNVDVSVATPVTVTIPDVSGMTDINAFDTTRKAGLQPVVTAKRQDPSAPGTILSQDPPAGSRAALGSIVSIIASSAIQVAVPAMVGRSLNFATEALQGSRLRLGTVSRTPTTVVPAGNVMQQSSPADSLVDIGSAINLTIAGNTNPVPDLTGKAEAAARALVTPLGFSLTVGAPKESSTVAVGLIADQDPKPAVVANVGSTVTVNLAIPPKVAVPSLIGKTIQDAQTAAAPFTISVTGQIESTQTPGTIAAQDPKPNDKASPGTVISVRTAVPISVAVPSFVNLSLAVAQASAVAAKLSLVVSQNVLSDKPANTVVVQSPDPGVHVAPGSQVSVTLSRGPGVIVPNVLSEMIVAARQILARVNLTPRETLVFSDEDPGTVVNQNPAAQVQVAPGTAVALSVSKGSRTRQLLSTRIDTATRLIQ